MSTSARDLGEAPLDFGFLYKMTRRNLEYGSPAMLCAVTLLLLALSSERTFIFAVILLIGVLFALACLVYESATSLHLFGFVLTWYFWLIYSYGYAASNEDASHVFVDTVAVSNADGTQDLVLQWGAGTMLFKWLFGFLLHGFGMLRTVREDGMAGLSLFTVAILVVLFDAVPCGDNNLFYEGWRTVIARLVWLLGLYALNTYRAERWKTARRDNAVRSFLQLEYTLFATPWLALGLWIVHVSLVIFDVGQQKSLDEKHREVRHPTPASPSSRAPHVPLDDVTVETHRVASEKPLSPHSSAVLSATGEGPSPAWTPANYSFV
jgi:hypothetical protein